MIDKRIINSSNFTLAYTLWKYFWMRFIRLYAILENVSQRKIFIGNIFITFWNICHALQIRDLTGGDAWLWWHKEPLVRSDRSATSGIACEDEKFERTYYGYSYIPQRRFLDDLRCAQLRYTHTTFHFANEYNKHAWAHQFFEMFVFREDQQITSNSDVRNLWFYISFSFYQFITFLLCYQ